MRRLASLLALAACALPGSAADLSKIDRTIKKEPAYKGKPGYLLLVFGPEAKDRVWLVRDGDSLYVDRNGDGDLTGAGEKVARSEPKARIDAESHAFDVGDLKVGGKRHRGLLLRFDPMRVLKGLPEWDDFRPFHDALRADPEALLVAITLDVESSRKGGGVGGRLAQRAGIDDAGLLRFADRPADAAILHFDGPLRATLHDPRPVLNATVATKLNVCLNTPGRGPGSAVALDYDKAVPEGLRPRVEILWPDVRAGGAPIHDRHDLCDRCCNTLFFDGIRAPESVGPGVAEVTVSFDAWREGRVAPTTRTVKVIRTSPPKALPVARELVATLPFSDEEKASVRSLRYSADGARLLARGQDGEAVLYDARTSKEVWRSRAGTSRRGMTVSPDLSRLYAARQTRKATPFEKDGKRFFRLEYSGDVEAWSPETGKASAPLKAAAGRGTSGVTLSPKGDFLLVTEIAGGVYGEHLTQTLVLVSLKDAARRELASGREVKGELSADGKTLAVIVRDGAKATLQAYDLPSAKLRASADLSATGLRWSLLAVSPDGSTVAVSARERGAERSQVAFFDGRTMRERRRWVGEKGEAAMLPGGALPDGESYYLFGTKTLTVYDARRGEVTRRFDFDADLAYAWAASPCDGKRLAAMWFPEDNLGVRVAEIDAKEMPQPRISLFDLEKGGAPRVLVCPHGPGGGLAFRPDGKTLAAGTSRAVLLFDVSN